MRPRRSRRRRVRPSSRARSGPRPTIQPPHSSATPALAGTNQVQSTAECTANTATTASSVSMPTRSASNGRPRSRRRRPVARNAASSHATAAAATREPRPAEVGERLHDVAVRVADGERVGRGSACGRSRTRPRRCRSTARWRGCRAPPPVAGAHRGGGGEPVRRVRRACARRVGELVPGLGDLPVDAAGGGRQRDQRDDRHERQNGERRAARELARSAASAGAAQPRSGRRGPAPSRTDTISSSRAPNSWPASTRAAIGARSVVRPSCENAHATIGAAPSTPAARATVARSRSGTIRNHSADAGHQRDQRAARVGEHHRHQQHADRRPGERVGGRVAGAAGGEPQHRRHAERGHQPDGVPVRERLAQPRVRLVRSQRGGEDLGQQRPAADEQAAGADADDAAPASGPARAVRARCRRRTRPGRRTCGSPRSRSRPARATTGPTAR